MQKESQTTLALLLFVVGCDALLLTKTVSTAAMNYRTSVFVFSVDTVLVTIADVLLTDAEPGLRGEDFCKGC